MGGRTRVLSSELGFIFPWGLGMRSADPAQRDHGPEALSHHLPHTGRQHSGDAARGKA